MATIIKSISFKNFYNYYGDFEQNCYEFTEGLNIVSADNNMGKSKFYNGVLWILKDEVYDGDANKNIPASESFLKMASAKAKKLMDSFDMAVKIMLRKDETEYSVIKAIRFTRKGENWDYGNVNFEVIITDKVGRTSCILDLKDKDKITKELFPTGLVPYVLLQGERFDDLVNLSSPKDLSSTIQTLAEISELIGACDVSWEMTTRAKNLLSSKELEVFSSQSAIEDTIKEKEKLERFIIETSKKIKAYRQDLNISRAKKEEYEVLRLNATKREKFRAMQEILITELKKLKKEKSEKEKQVTSQLFGGTHPWILIGLKEEITKYSNLRDKWVEEKATVKLVKDNSLIFLPDNIPDVPSLHRMLEKGVCEVCGQKAPKHSEAWEHIKMLMNRPATGGIKNDFSLFFSNIQTTVAAFYNSISEIGQNIEEYQELLDEIKVEIEKKEEEREEATVNFMNVGGEKERFDKDILDSYFLAEKNEERYEKLIKDLKVQIANWERRLVQIEEDLVRLAGKNERIKEYRNFRNLIQRIEAIFKDSKERIYGDIIASLQKNANQKYKELTAGNLTSGGRLEFIKQDDDTVRVFVKNVEDVEIVGLGTGYQRMKQLAIIMAIISSKIGSKHFQYPFIADAPFSEFGDNFIRNFFKVAPCVFTQSIILIKELYDPEETHDYLNSLGKTVLKEMTDGNLKGTFYVNIVEGNPDMSEMETKHKRYC